MNQGNGWNNVKKRSVNRSGNLKPNPFFLKSLGKNNEYDSISKANDMVYGVDYRTFGGNDQSVGNYNSPNDYNTDSQNYQNNQSFDQNPNVTLDIDKISDKQIMMLKKLRMAKFGKDDLVKEKREKGVENEIYGGEKTNNSINNEYKKEMIERFEHIEGSVKNDFDAILKGLEGINSKIDHIEKVTAENKKEILKLNTESKIIENMDAEILKKETAEEKLEKKELKELKNLKSNSEMIEGVRKAVDDYFEKGKVSLEENDEKKLDDAINRLDQIQSKIDKEEGEFKKLQVQGTKIGGILSKLPKKSDIKTTFKNSEKAINQPKKIVEDQIPNKVSGDSLNDLEGYLKAKQDHINEMKSFLDQKEDWFSKKEKDIELKFHHLEKKEQLLEREFNDFSKRSAEMYREVQIKKEDLYEKEKDMSHDLPDDVVANMVVRLKALVRDLERRVSLGVFEGVEKKFVKVQYYYKIIRQVEQRDPEMVAVMKVSKEDLLKRLVKIKKAIAAHKKH